MRKTALIVDDSKSARVVLKRMLETYDLAVDTTESAEAALDYLNHHRPDVIFMDHLMPGMDGFEAVTAIKKNPDTAMIPIMMYTSQEGEVYVGQARALGAVGVLPKTVKPVEVSKVLASLHLADGPATQHDREATEPREAIGAQPPIDGDIRSLLQDLFDQQRIILQRELRDTYSDIAARFANESRQPPAADAPANTQPDEPGARANNWFTTLLLAIIVFAAVLFWREGELNTLRQQNHLLRSDLPGSSSVPPGAGTRQQAAGLDRALAASRASTVSALEWGINQSAAYGWNEIPLGVRRQQLFEQLLTRLIAVGFVGEVVVDIHSGDFCTVEDGNGTLEPAAADLDAADCDQIGPGPAEPQGLGYQQSVAFANFVVMAEERSGGAIRFSISSVGNSAPLIAYPESAAGVSAGEWNGIAATNQRVTVTLLPHEA